MSITIALAGNPNCGKTTLFNKLTGANQRTGNWPGVTVDRKTGKVRGHDIDVVDLPGIYSLSPYSPEEIVSRDYMIKGDENGVRPDAILNIVDATNLERNLFLTLQILDIGLPTVIALNMMDAIEKAGDKIDIDKLSKDLGCRIIPISATTGMGVEDLPAAIEDVVGKKEVPSPVHFDGDIEAVISEAAKALEGKDDTRFSAVKLVEKDKMTLEKYPEAAKAIEASVKALEEKKDDDADSIIADARYNAISSIVEESVKKAPRESEDTLSDRIDRVVTSRVWGIPIFLCVLIVIFLGVIGFSTYDDSISIQGIGTWCTDWMNDTLDSINGNVADWCDSNDVNTALSSLLCDGILSGVFAVIGFLPQMLILFLVMCILEDVGYMSRIAFVMDRVFRHFGLSGKSLIPLIVGTGCGVPGIMASRTIESERDRRITAMTVTFIPCGAKLPVISMLVSYVFGGNGLIAVLCYVVGVIMVLISGIILKKFRNLSGAATPFIMELPPYHIPSAVNIIKGTLDRGWAFVKKAGTIILLSAILIWFLSHYTPGLEFVTDEEMNKSILKYVGDAIGVLFVPLGWDLGGANWKLTAASITGLIAKENLVSTFGILFYGDSSVEDIEALSGAVSYASGLSLLFFNLMCAPCFAAIGAMHRELGSWKDTGMAVCYQIIMAWCLGQMFYGFVSWLDGRNVIAGEDYGGSMWVILSVIILALWIYLLWAKDPFHQLKGKDQYDAENEVKM